MTAVAAITDGTTCWLAADSAEVSSYDLTIRTEPKVWAAGPYLFGLSGDGRAGQVLRYAFTAPGPPGDGDLMEFMCTQFVDALRECYKAAGFAKKEHEREEAEGACFLAATGGRLFKVWQNYQVGEREDRIDAIGCGEDYVLGSLHTTAGLGMGPVKRLGMALEAAARFSAGVHPPFTVVSGATNGSGLNITLGPNVTLTGLMPAEVARRREASPEPCDA